MKRKKSNYYSFLNSPWRNLSKTKQKDLFKQNKCVWNHFNWGCIWIELFYLKKSWYVLPKSHCELGSNSKTSIYNFFINSLSDFEISNTNSHNTCISKIICKLLSKQKIETYQFQFSTLSICLDSPQFILY